MSYDFELFRPRSGQSVEDALAEFLAQREHDDDDSPGELSADLRMLQQRVVAALQTRNPRLTAFEFDYPLIAKDLGVSEVEARRQFQHVELNGPDDGTGIQIQVDGPTATVTVPYWHTGVKARETFAEIWSYLEILQREGGYCVFDGQLERILNLDTDMKESLTAYGSIVGMMPELVKEATGAKPWWRFW